jgi:hypothetical protein
MTLSVRFPDAKPTDFAWSAGPAFAGRHAFCPACAREDAAPYGGAIARCLDAGLWRLACHRHRVFLESVRDARDVYASRRIGRRDVRVPRLPMGDPVQAPFFALIFEAAAARAARGVHLGPLWSVREPAAFLDLACTLGGLMLVQRRPGQDSQSAAATFLGDNMLTQAPHGAADYEPDLIRKVASYARVRGFAAAALLLLSPAGLARLRISDWAKRNVPYSSPFLLSVAPWEVAAETWGRRTLERVFELASGWPSPISTEAQNACRRRLRLMGAEP